MKMEDASRTRTIDKIIHSVLSRIGWSSQQIKSACPTNTSEEKWPWNKVRYWIEEFDKKRIKLIKVKEDNATPSQYHYELKDEKDVVISGGYNELSRCKYEYCEIKMQDPCAPCCCAIECIEPPPCTDIPRIERTPTCGCSIRKKIKTASKCCDACGAGLETA